MLSVAHRLNTLKADAQAVNQTFQKVLTLSLNVITRTADHAQCQMQTLASSVSNHNHHLQFYIVLYNIYILDKSIGLWRVIW